MRGFVNCPRTLRQILNHINFSLKVYQALGLGIVAKCTLTGAVTAVKNIKVDGRSYCAVYHGSKKHTEAVEFCKNLNARLPLPRNKAELDSFVKFYKSYGNYKGTYTHVDARNPKKTSNKAEWVDAEDKPLGNRPVYLMGHKFLTLSVFFFIKLFEL